MKALLSTTALLFLASAAPVMAADDIAKLNQIIDQTNFVVANQCSGTLISLKYRLVLTNNHCLEGYVSKVEKEETSKDGEVKKVTREIYKDMELTQKRYKDFREVAATSFQAEIIAHSEKYDLALLQIKDETIPMTLASKVAPEGHPVLRGEHVYVVGNPHLLDANLNEGVVSSTSRSIEWDAGEIVPYYGIDAGVNPGNSGGALYDADFDLIGVPGATLRGATGIGFAVPDVVIRKFLKANCYEDVWNDAAKEDHDKCESDKLEKVNAIRAKAGLPPLDKPEKTMSGGATMIDKADLIFKPETPAPAAAPAPVPPASGASRRTPAQLFMSLIESLTN